MAGNFFNGAFFGGGYFGSITPSTTPTGAGPGWQLFRVQDDSTGRWRKQRKTEEQLRAILERAIAKALGKDDRRAENIVAEHSDRKTDTDARPEVLARQVDYTALLRDIAAVEYLLGIYYQRKVQIESDDDDDFLLLSSL